MAWNSFLNYPSTGVSLSVAGTIAAYIQADQNARGEDRYNRANQAIGSQIATEGAIMDWHQLALARDQERLAAGEALREFTSGLEADQSTARVAGLEGGAAGATLEAITSSYRISRLKSESNFRRNQLAADAQYVAQAHGVQQRLRSTLFELVPRPAQKPNVLGYGLSGLADALEAYQGYKKQKT